MGEALFKGFGGALRGLERGLLIKNQMKQDALDRAVEAEDRQLMMQDRAMQQREFELRMKQAGLALESAEFEHARSLAMGTPKEQADRALAEQQRAIQNDIEMHAANLANIRAETAESQARSEYYRQGGSRGGTSGSGSTKEDERFSDEIKSIDMDIKQLRELKDEAIDAGDTEAANAIQDQIGEMMNRREMLRQAETANRGITYPETEQAGGGAGDDALAAVEENKGAGGIIGASGSLLRSHPGQGIIDLLIGSDRPGRELLGPAVSLRAWAENPEGPPPSEAKVFLDRVMMNMPASTMQRLANAEGGERNKILAQAVLDDPQLGELIGEANLGPETWQFLLAGSPYAGKLPFVGKMLSGAAGKAGGAVTTPINKLLGLFSRPAQAVGGKAIAGGAPSSVARTLALPPATAGAPAIVLESGAPIPLASKVLSNPAVYSGVQQPAATAARAVTQGIPGGAGPMIPGPTIAPYAAMAGAARNTAQVGRGLAPAEQQAVEVLLRGLGAAAPVADDIAAAGPMISPATQGAGYFGPSMQAATIDLRALAQALMRAQ